MERTAVKRVDRILYPGLVLSLALVVIGVITKNLPTLYCGGILATAVLFYAGHMRRKGRINGNKDHIGRNA